MQQIVDCLFEPLARYLLGLARLRPEAGAPEQPFSLLLAEGTVVDGNLWGGHPLMKGGETVAGDPLLV
jgi:hypothetical protein